MTVGSLALCGAWHLKYAEVGAPEQGEEQEGFVPHCRQDSIQFLLFFFGGEGTHTLYGNEEGGIAIWKKPKPTTKNPWPKVAGAVHAEEKQCETVQ